MVLSSISKAEDLLFFLVDLQSDIVYKLIRLLFVAWMIHPKYKGALYLYFSKLEPLFKKNERTVRERTLHLLNTYPTYLSSRFTKLVDQISSKLNKGKSKKEPKLSISKSEVVPTKLSGLIDPVK